MASIRTAGVDANGRLYEDLLPTNVVTTTTLAANGLTRGVANGVAGLNASGQVVDAFGQVAGSGSASGVGNFIVFESSDPNAARPTVPVGKFVLWQGMGTPPANAVTGDRWEQVI